MGTHVRSSIFLSTGSPCNNFQGYCDVFLRCRGVDAEGPLTRLKKLLFNPETLRTIKDWIVVGRQYQSTLIMLNIFIYYTPLLLSAP